MGVFDKETKTTRTVVPRPPLNSWRVLESVLGLEVLYGGLFESWIVLILHFEGCKNAGPSWVLRKFWLHCSDRNMLCMRRKLLQGLDSYSNGMWPRFESHSNTCFVILSPLSSLIYMTIFSLPLRIRLCGIRFWVLCTKVWLKTCLRLGLGWMLTTPIGVDSNLGEVKACVYVVFVLWSSPNHILIRCMCPTIYKRSQTTLAYFTLICAIIDTWPLCPCKLPWVKTEWQN